jgi:hypothetical protein
VPTSVDTVTENQRTDAEAAEEGRHHGQNRN